MSLPVEVVFTTLTGQILLSDATGTPASGTVTFHQQQVLRDSEGHVVLAPAKYPVTLNGTGDFSVTIPCTNSPEISPQNFTYEVEVDTNAWAEVFNALIPSGTTSFANIVPVQTPSLGQAYALLGHVHPTPAARVLTNGPNFVADARTGQYFRFTLTADSTLDVVNQQGTDHLQFEIVQDGTGGHALVLSSAFHFGVTLPSYTVTPTANKRDLLGAIYSDALDKLLVVAAAKAY